MPHDVLIKLQQLPATVGIAVMRVVSAQIAVAFPRMNTLYVADFQSGENKTDPGTQKGVAIPFWAWITS